ncbi:MAG TPA: Crp/Fnr family transcriptional regulator [Polyangia bacterium]|nr:Crp/Fnr family transcriptional regulator [Polyangia bacterium]
MMHDRCTTLDSGDPNVRWRTLLSGMPLLRHCGAGELAALAERLRVRSYPAGSLVIAQDERSQRWSFLATGRVRLVLFGENGREMTLAELDAGDFFGESALASDEAHSTSVIALTDITVLTLSDEAFVAHLQAYPTTAVRLASELVVRLTAAQRALAEAALHTVEQRLVRTLVRWGMQHGARETDSGLVLPTRPTHQVLAQMVGTSRETITRAFAALAKRQQLFADGECLLLSAPLVDL